MAKLFKIALRTCFYLLLFLLAVEAYLQVSRMEFLNTQWFLWTSEVLGVLFSLYVLMTAFVIFFEKRNPNKTVSWLLVLFLLPGIGIVFYLIFGQDVRKKWRLKKKERNYPKVERNAELQKHIVESIQLFSKEESRVSQRLLNLLLANSNSPFYVNSKVSVLTNGSETYDAMFEKIRGAAHHIHLEMFIIRNDRIGNELKDLLIEKAREGVKVRVLYDSVGSWTLGTTYRRALESAGVEVEIFFPVLFPVIRRELNYRNHRKILIVDGITGFVGGLNIGDEYLGANEKLGFWRDTHLMLTGDCVYTLQSIFARDWEFTCGKALIGEQYFPPAERTGGSVVQIAASGPDSDWQAILQAYFTMIATAEKRIWIASPYLVPEDSLLMGLKTAALSGIDVRIIIPSKADHFLVYWASRDNIEALLEAGVRIFTYEKGFIHCKILLVDGIGASIGTANLDVRSLEINFEVNAFIYDKVLVNRLEMDFQSDLMDSREIILEDFRHRGLRQRFLESLGRIVSPLQ